MISLRKHEPDILKGIVAGLVAGLAATWVKSKVQKKIGGSFGTGEPLTSRSGEESSTVKVAEVISQKVLKRELKQDEKPKAGAAVDFAFGTAMGGFYGGLSEVLPEIGAADGLAFGTTLWAVGDELGVPAAGLAKWPQNYPMSVHAKALGGHLAYGVALELVRKIFRRLLD